MPTDEAMTEVAEATFDNLAIIEVMKVIEHRLADKFYYRHAIKATKLLSYLFEYGSNRVVEICSGNSRIQKALDHDLSKFFPKEKIISSIEDDIFRDLRFWKLSILKKLSERQHINYSPPCPWETDKEKCPKGDNNEMKQEIETEKENEVLKPLGLVKMTIDE
jgi:hypothetical protein